MIDRMQVTFMQCFSTNLLLYVNGTFNVVVYVVYIYCMCIYLYIVLSLDFNNTKY